MGLKNGPISKEFIYYIYRLKKVNEAGLEYCHHVNEAASHAGNKYIL